ncbi:hypothetical protein [Acetanaerobacterium elongatum]|uniref:Ig-like domain (Group 2) n=1 Tax=Acetanaerobacterium elongatum TaxID=258515 RepID=A0A1H0G779_9FIRM|nr:hypothetical protein [Acetanaerobacterium elongatum]SDO02674.1 hypothetical protein SAMN05192585_1489 [Acetanaerobacterium elongatum]
MRKVIILLFVLNLLVGCSNQGKLNPISQESSSSKLSQESSQVSSLNDISSTAAASDIYSLEIADDYDAILEVGETTKLEYTYTGYKEPIISFVTEDKDVVVVDTEGVVTAKHGGIGSIVILIKESDNSNPKFQRIPFEVV